MNNRELIFHQHPLGDILPGFYILQCSRINFLDYLGNNFFITLVYIRQRVKENLLPVYVPKEQNVIQRVLKDHFSDFEEQYDELYAKQYGKYRIIRIKEAVENFIECGDYSKGIARIKCTNHNCDHEYFRPFVAS
ncbi:hypothetical protein LCGC14_2442870, partial [marine sediment metagenome]